MMNRLKKLVKPDRVYSDLLQVDFVSLANQGYKLILLDVDNTLAPHGAFEADDFAREVIGCVQSAGLDCRIVTNATWRRARRFASTLDVPLSAQANKPSARAIRMACQKAGIPTSQCVMIGDQLLTDIIAAHRAGCLAILVRPRSTHENWAVKAKRILEKAILGREDNLV